MWYNSVCLDELNSGALCFQKPSSFRKPNVYGQSALHDWDNPPPVHLGNDGNRGGRFVMKPGAKANLKHLDFLRQTILTRRELTASGIYAIINTFNGHLYVGQSKCLFKRKQAHFRDLAGNCHANPYLQNAYNYYGKGTFRFVAVEFCPEDELDLKEQYWIERIKPEYNIARNVFADPHRPKNDVIPHHQDEKFDRPAWHAWVYGGAKNPLLKVHNDPKKYH